MKKRINNLIVYYISIMIILFLFIGCFNKKNGNQSISSENIKIDIDSIDKNDTVYFTDIFSDYKIIPLETKKECLVGQINSIRFCDDKIVVLDSRIGKAVFVFDRNGKFIRKIGKIGKGPGEYVSPGSIATDEDKKEVAIYDEMLNRIQLFSLDGKFINSIKIKQKLACKSIEISDNKIYLSNYIHKSIKYLLFAIDPDGQIVGEWLPNQYEFQNNSTTAPYNIFLRTSHEVRFRDHLMNIVYNIKGNLVKPFITLESKNHITTKELEELYGKGSRPRKKQSNFKNRKFIGISSYSEVNNFSILEYSNNTNNYTLFYNQKNKKVKCVKFLNFKDDLTHFSGRQSGYFFSSYGDGLIASVNQYFMSYFIENIKNGKISSDNLNLINLTMESNPVIIIYKCRKNPLL